MNYGRKVSLRDAHELVQIFLHMGKEVAAAECAARGISPGYALIFNFRCIMVLFLLYGYDYDHDHTACLRVSTRRAERRSG